MIYLDLFFSFAKIGCFGFGGGYSILPLLNKSIVENKKWCTEKDLLNYYTIGQITPGVISVNASTFIGYKVAGVLGSIFATLGMITPSIIIISLIAKSLNSLDNIYINYALNGIKIAICILMIDTIYKLAKKALLNYKHIFIYISVLIAALLNINNILIISIVFTIAMVVAYRE